VAAVNVCTIIAKNYVAHARVLARSLTAHNADARLWTLIIDDFSGYIDPAEEPFEVLTPEQIGCDPFIHMALRYSVLELSTAVKPWLMRHLLAETGEPVTYLDPDIRIYGPISLLDECAAEHGVALIPHNSEPIPPDGRKPSQVDVMIAGVYNLGYVSLAPGPEVDRLLDWWSDRLLRDCRVDPVWGYFVDQRWFDLAPGFLTDFAIVREPEFNVAYWNLHSRTLALGADGYLVDKRPLAFFHFSGFDPERPLILSRHQDRIDVAHEPVLERLLAEYAGEVMGEGHAVSRRWPYSYEALGDGTRIDDTIRALYDDFEQERRGSFASPFTLEGARCLKDWMRAQDPGAPVGVSRALARVYADRDDVRSAFPDLASCRPALIEWAREYGRREMPSLEWGMAANGADSSGAGAVGAGRLPDPVPTAAAEETIVSGGGAWGVNVIACVDGEVEMRESASLLVGALDTEAIPALPLTPDSKLPLADAPFPVNLICVQPGGLRELATRAGGGLFAGRYSIGFWLWPGSRLPDRLAGSFSLVDEVWAPSEHVARVLEPVATVPVTTVPLPVGPPAPGPESRARLGLPDDTFLYLLGLDYLAGFERKNPLALIEAFRSAFSGDPGAGLVVHCLNSDRDQAAHRTLLAAAGEEPGIRIVEDRDESVSLSTLACLCDCYASLHRSEAFGLGLATAMWLGKPVIATGYSGNLEFMTADNSMLVDYRLVPAGPSPGPGDEAGEWAEASIEHASALMRRVFEDRDAAGRLGTTAAADIRRTHSARAAGEVIARRLESIRATGRPRAAASPVLERPPALAGLPLKLRRGPVPRGRPTGPRATVRKLILRTMQPFTRYQQEVNDELLRALDQLNEQVADLRREIARERGQLLAELRREQRRRASDDD
jgi:glycosyltransferase involved in cell wall biosynthesis